MENYNTLNNNDDVGAPVRRHHHRHNVKSRYEFIKTLGKGTYGKVKLARHKESNQLVAVKTIRKDKIKDTVDMKHIRREMEIMSSIQHPHIIEIFEVFENQDKIVIVMEYAAGGELYDFLSQQRGVSDNEARSFFRQIVSAVSYCHQMGIAHRDLKLENILLDQDRRIKIADFGLANSFKSESLLNTFCGSPLYASPEIVCGIPYKGPEVDSWSLGVLLYALVYGTMPFDGRNFSLLTKQITSGNFCQPSKSSDAYDLIAWMLTVDPAHRATIVDIARHHWVNMADDSISNVPTPSENMASFQSYLERSMESFDKDDELEETLKPSDVVDESIPRKSILKRSSEWWDRPDDETQIAAADDEDLAGQLAAVCGLHAKDSLKLKSKPHSASGKRRVLRSKRDRESGYYSSPERPASQKGDTSETKNAKSVPKIKQTLVTGGRMSRLSSKQRVTTPSKPNLQNTSKECYLAPVNPGLDERLVSVSSDDGCSVGSHTRPTSTYSDSSILSSDSFDLCTFDKTKYSASDQNQVSVPFNQNHSNSKPKLSIQTADKNASYLNDAPSGTLTPKSEKFVRDIKRILAPSGRRHRDSNQSRVQEPGHDNSQLTTMVNQLNVDLDVAYKKAIDICANLRSAEV